MERKDKAAKTRRDSNGRFAPRSASYGVATPKKKNGKSGKHRNHGSRGDIREWERKGSDEYALINKFIFTRNALILTILALAASLAANFTLISMFVVAK